jgi:hypothetical protein
MPRLFVVVSAFKAFLFISLSCSCSAVHEIPIIHWDQMSLFPCSQELGTGPYPEPDESSTHAYHVSQTYFHIVFPSMPRLFVVVSAFKAFLFISPSCSCSAVHEIPPLLCNRRFITKLTSAHHWSLSGST